MSEPAESDAARLSLAVAIQRLVAGNIDLGVTATSTPATDAPAAAATAAESAAEGTDAILALIAEEQPLLPVRESVNALMRGLFRAKRHKSEQRSATAGVAVAAIDDALDADLLGVCLAFLDFTALTACELVSQQWRRVLQDPVTWEQFYCSTWRGGRAVPSAAAAAYRRELLPHFKRICRQRVGSNVAVSTRARSWTRQSGNVFCHNDSMTRRNFALGCTESIRSERAIPSLAFAKELSLTVCYFEATVMGCGSVGFASISTASERNAYGFGSESHLGWYPTSYGYHGDDGLFYWNSGHRLGALGGSHKAFGPQWGDTTPFRKRRWDRAVVGCGYVAESSELFYTLNGKLVGVAPVEMKLSDREFAAAVSLHQFGDSVELNFGCTAFAFDVEQFVWEKAAATRAKEDGDGERVRLQMRQLQVQNHIASQVA